MSEDEVPHKVQSTEEKLFSKLEGFLKQIDKDKERASIYLDLLIEAAELLEKVQGTLSPNHIYHDDLNQFALKIVDQIKGFNEEDEKNLKDIENLL